MKNIQDSLRYMAAHFKSIGREGVKQGLILYYALVSPQTPVWAKTLIAGGLVYLVTPLDAIPDVLPAGFTDDLAVLLAVSLRVACCLDRECERKAEEQLCFWFGEGAGPAPNS
jgi:uncharacterized membrane protein YkvA (DUF1232 family)